MSMNPGDRPTRRIAAAVVAAPAALLEKLGEWHLRQRVWHEAEESRLEPAEILEYAEQLHRYCLRNDCLAVAVAARLPEPIHDEDQQVVLEALVWRIALQEAVVKPREKR